ncbi:pyruvate:ferredoxin oxidoreductase/NADPH-cytochrome P450, putative [Perkinsus marinus ATCC 50983]|uniref:pyruvate dehydrogenase (NADP(+)) n=3 Tax=Perkinsus marinus (strain ATCC 50983 / TXsc) TaxID=423536 RepID=C5LEU5_PERM5|nr:pyruvate:ferredoxin oxidoreductase/NADPH-cytochrome P450, putative [Perkinsus marinus ATCC 50983]EER04711.1 pyruvate:ferredoxin oxidoreductase/NADPH-cytochrome P450, putative [Perkinsus marinus ATCC 50983]|eukprot:XP_002772895.1 pyruvate:ferredoxin oxidoreductase/NADPH-cytochrome P450, putative [Perkinsus marinus ATCC 50983]
MLSTLNHGRSLAVTARSLAIPAQAGAITGSSRHFAGKASPSGGQWQTMDGCTAVCHVSYAMMDTAYIYPITPSSPAAELAEQWSALGVKNAFGDVPKITQMQSEAGAAGALHGALAAGSLATTYTASQGLLLMVPNMYKIAGELLPCVMHVAARAVAGQALSIFGDHQDVMAVRQTGFAMIDADTVQECHDMALVSHLATLRARVPFVSFFDGFRLSHCIEKVDTLPYNQMRRMIDRKALNAHRARALNPTRPYVRGTNENPDVYFQQFEASNAFYDKTPEIVKEEMDRVGAVTGRHYDLFQWTGPKDAEAAIVILGSGASVIEESLPFVNSQGKKVGVLKPRLYRPWSAEDFLKALPQSVKRIAVLDRTKEPGSLGEPLYLDVASTIQESNRSNIKVIGGRWGLGQKEFTPKCVAAVADNLYAQYPKDHFSVGIEDDVTHRSLPLTDEINVSHPKTVECLIYGYGSDGTVGANKNATKIIGDNTDLYVQAYFAYGSQKAGGLTMSHLRFGPEPIKSYYSVNKADYVGCHNPTYLDMYRMTEHLKDNGTFCLNSPFTTVEEWNKHVPAGVRKSLADKNAKVFNVDAFKVAQECGMGRMINVVMQSAFFKLANVMDFKECIGLYKNTIRKSYGHRGEAVVQKNYEMIDKALDAITEIKVPAEWKNLSDSMLHYEQTYHNALGNLAKDKSAINKPSFTQSIQGPIALLQGDDIPVSAFANDELVGGKVPLGTAKVEKRGVALMIPIVDMDKCTHCNICAMSCPHACIRPFLLSQAEDDAKPSTFDTRKAKGGAEVAGLHYRIQVSPLDCTGCEVCVNACPDDALRMEHLSDFKEAESQNWEYAVSLPDRSSRFDNTTLKGSQFYQPLLEFHGACAGCGETPYVRLLTQMFGDRMMIANATGCSSIWGAPYGSTPFAARRDGTGPAWANSLFEDAAEYGMGMAVTTAVRRKALKVRVQEMLLEGRDTPLSPELYTQLNEWVENFRNPAVCAALSKSLPPLLKAEASKDPAIQDILDVSDLLPKISNWIIGGDGWGYDIGYGGLDHVIASGQDLNVLVLDTEAYSNTGGQKSKATPIGAVAKFATMGHDVEKKNLAEMAMDYGTVYVASVSMGANYQQTLKAFSEAEDYDGCSVIVAYSPCIEHKNLDGMTHTMQHQATVAASGYFPLYRYNPMLKRLGKNPFVLDTKRLTKNVDAVISNEMRFGALKKRDADLYKQYSSQLDAWVRERYSKYQRWAALGQDSNISDGVPLTLLYGTETGTAEALSYRVAELARQRGYAVKVMQCDEMDVSELPENKNLMVLCSTTGEGTTPRTALDFTSQLQSAVKDNSNAHLLDGVQYSVFALGDSSYHHFCTAGKRIDDLFAQLGGERTVAIGLGNDQDDDKYETAFEDWMPSYWKSVNAPEPVDDGSIPDSQFEVRELDSDEAVVAPYERIMPPQTIQLGLTKNDRLTPSDYERDIRHLRFELEDGQDLPYLLGDVLNIHPMNEAGRVSAFLQSYGLNPTEMVKITPVSENIDARKRAAALRPRTISQLFEESLDIFGRPNRAFYKSLSKFAEDPKEKAELALIGDSDDTKGRDMYTKLAAETVTFADVLNKYTSARPSLDQLITLIPCTKPRLYSIASSPRFVGPKAIELAVVIVNWTTPSGARRTGTATDYIQRIVPGQKTTATITSGSFKFPESPMTPMIMAGLGTGLAPFRAFSQERAWMKRQGIETGPMWLFYGCRHQNKDYIFGNELESFVEEGAITELHPAFSRDQKEKVYVQNKIDDNSSRIYEDLIKKGGYFYLCGQAGQVENDIRSAVYRAIAKGENVSMEKAKEIFEDLAENDRYCPEVY